MLRNDVTRDLGKCLRGRQLALVAGREKEKIQGQGGRGEKSRDI